MKKKNLVTQPSAQAPSTPTLIIALDETNLKLGNVSWDGNSIREQQTEWDWFGGKQAMSEPGSGDGASAIIPRESRTSLILVYV